jgi:hypothetical protein
MTSSSCIERAFMANWSKPVEPLDNGYFPVRVNEVFSSKHWSLVDRELYREDWSILVDLNPPWFVYYIPMMLLSALEEANLPDYMHDAGWMTLFEPGSLFSEYMRANGCLKLSGIQLECLYSVASRLGILNYGVAEMRGHGGFEYVLRQFVSN